MLQLHAHNKTAYANLVRLFEAHSRVACVQPTGTGKSFIVLKLIEDSPRRRFLAVSPSVYIFSQYKKYARDYGVSLKNVDFITYAKLASLGKNEMESLDYDCIVLDEFHRCGALEWGRGVNMLLACLPGAKVLGTSATPIRYLDSCRNMAEELFSNVYAVNMGIGEAIREKILPTPIYITAMYSFADELGRLQAKAEKTKNPKLRLTLLGKIQQAKRMISQVDCGLDEIFGRHIKNNRGKYIVFCSDVEKLLEAYDECGGWFKYVNKNVHKYCVYSGNAGSKKQFEAFAADNDPAALKLLLCVDMLNEGVHIDGVEGVIMLRSTKSANVFYQQLGRALTCGSDKVKNPVIFDIVNNYEVGAAEGQCEQITDFIRESCGFGGDISFRLYDYVRDIRDILDELRASFEGSWDMVFDTLKAFAEEKGRFPFNDEAYDGLLLGRWCANQRRLYKSGALKGEQIAALNSLGFPWDVHEQLWENMLNNAKEFYIKNGRFPVKGDTDENVRPLYYWLINQRCYCKRGDLDEGRAERLRAIGFELDTVSADELWEMRFEELEIFIKQNGRILEYGDVKANPRLQPLYDWLKKQLARKKSGKMTAEQAAALEQAGVVWDKTAEQWNRHLGELQAFVKERGRVPKNSEKYGGFALGQWYIRILKKYRDGSLEKEKARRLEESGVPLVTAGELAVTETWDKNYGLLKGFILENNRLPYAREIYKGVNLYGWLGHQKEDCKAGALSAGQIEKLAELGVNIADFGVKKQEPTDRWQSTYNKYIDFINQKGYKPRSRISEEKNLYAWVSAQKQRYKNNKLSEHQKRMLAEAGII